MTQPAPVPDGADLAGFAPEADLRAFRSALGAFGTGVTVITARDAQGAPAGITANSFASVSLDPPLVLWCPKRDSRRYETFTGAEAFAVHVLSRDQQSVCDAFVRSASAFDAAPWREGPERLPLLDGCLALFLCRREAILPAGDHSIVLGRVWRVSRRDGAPLVFQGGRYGAFRPANELHPGPEAEP